jgi:hypothetical protein
VIEFRLLDTTSDECIVIRNDVDIPSDTNIVADKNESSIPDVSECHWSFGFDKYQDN